MLNRKTLLRLQFGAGARILFYETLRDFVREGVSVYEIIKRFESGAALFKAFPTDVLKAIMNSMRGGSKVSQDASLGAALEPWAPAMETALIAAGERMGHLDVALHEASQMMRARERMRGMLIAKLSYPAMLVLMLAAVLGGLGKFLIPLLEQMEDRAKWPAAAKIIGFLADHSAVITTSMLSSITAFAIIFAITAPRWTGAARDFFDRYIPPWTIYREMQGSIALMTISMLTASGLPMTTAFDLLRTNSSPWVSDHMARIMMRMRSGKSEAAALAGTGHMGTMFDRYTAWQISLYSAANSSMAAKLRSLSESSTTRVEASIAKTSGIVKWVTMGLVAFLLVMTYVSYMSVTSQASSMGGI
ncbi:type II secretory pathway component PulF [Roseateles asaccharophilus]|uniref:type II secretion system F family protein n=1 Tax=Roseateles asaccharophilus TaxID=582607 RepID=UPI0038324C94